MCQLLKAGKDFHVLANEANALNNIAISTFLHSIALFTQHKLTRCPRDFTPRDLAPPGQIPRDPAPPGQIPRDLALPARPPLGISPPSPPPNDTFKRIFLYLDLVTKKASEIWFGNLSDNGFARVRLRANVVRYFQKLELTSLSSYM